MGKGAGQTRGASNPHAAVSIKPGIQACEAALKLRDKRYLAGAQPTLPLTDCDEPGHCQCRLEHHGDRRNPYSDDRRIGIGLQSELYGASGEDDRRRRHGRRLEDRR